MENRNWNLQITARCCFRSNCLGFYFFSYSRSSYGKKTQGWNFCFVLCFVKWWIISNPRFPIRSKYIHRPRGTMTETEKKLPSDVLLLLPRQSSIYTSDVGVLIRVYVYRGGTGLSWRQNRIPYSQGSSNSKRYAKGEGEGLALSAHVLRFWLGGFFFLIRVCEHAFYLDRKFPLLLSFLDMLIVCGCLLGLEQLRDRTKFSVLFGVTWESVGHLFELEFFLEIPNQSWTVFSVGNFCVVDETNLILRWESQWTKSKWQKSCDDGKFDSDLVRIILLLFSSILQ